MLTKNISPELKLRPRLIILSAFLLSSFLWTSCKKLVDIPTPPNEVDTEEAFTDSAGVGMAVNGMYSFMYNYNHTGGSPYKTYLTTFTSLTADETTYFSGNSLRPFQDNTIPVSNTNNLQIWTDSYKAIYMANQIIENIGRLEKASQAYRDQIMGEAKFMRAFCHFYLTNVYGRVPIISSTDVKATGSLPRSSQAEVYKLVVDDLLAAERLLGADYMLGGRTRVNKFAASAMLARVYLYTEKWPEAEAASSRVINESAYMLEVPARKFLSGSKESIFQFDASTFNMVYIGEQFTPNPWDGIPKFVVRDGLLNAFETGDERKTAWVGTVEFEGDEFAYPFKYKTNWGVNEPGEADMVLRLGEQYLIRAEARAHRNNISGAEDDVNEIRNNAGLGDVDAVGQVDILELVAKERRVELCYEWGHRWFDLKRTGKAATILQPLKATWKSTAVLFPVPQQAITRNNSLLPQNLGYAGGQ